MKRLTNNDFIEKTQKIHSDMYDYSKVIYVNNKTKICVICSKHGEFWIRPNDFLNGQGCPECGKERLRNLKSFTISDFIIKAKQVHGDKYDYSKVNYVNSDTKVCIVCHEHGDFWQTPHNHLNGQGCPECCNIIRRNNRRFTANEFIKKAREIHGDKYDYSNVEYINNKTKVCIICPEHGEFYQKPCGHLIGYGCPKCKGDSIRNALKDDFESFYKKAINVHGNKYDYSKVSYERAQTKVCIICPEHGEFWQTPGSHLNGAGCPKCNMSHLERDAMLFLERHNINYEYQKHFKWLGKQSLDFYLPDYNIAIECQGIQHFEPIEYFGGEEKFKKVQRMDEQKKQLCEKHNIKLKYYK